MNSRLKTATVLTLALFWSRTFLFAADAPKDPLWRKAVAVAAANADWVPETATNGIWLAKTTTATSTISVMFIKADARTTTTFSEHWKKPQHETIPGKDRN